MNACLGEERASASPPEAPHVIGKVGVETRKGRGTRLGNARSSCELQIEASLEVRADSKQSLSLSHSPVFLPLLKITS